MEPDDDTNDLSVLQTGFPEDVELPPAQIAELSEACREYVLRAVGVELDYTPETLSVLDHYIQASRESVSERPELTELLVRGVGAYFGEVLRRMAPGFWLVPSADSHDWLLCFSDVYFALNPVAVAWDALMETTEHQGPSSELVLDRGDRELIERRLAEMPPVPEDEYWLLTTRQEVVEVVIEQLRIEMQHAGTHDVSFEPADYEVMPKPLGSA